MLYENTYRHCDIEWCQEAECMCNDRCPICNKEIEPYKTREIVED